MATQAVIEKQIQANSPFKVVVKNTNMLSAQVKVWIYTGTQGGSIPAGIDAEGIGSAGRPGPPTYTLKGVSTGDIFNRTNSFEISSLVNGWIKETYNGTPNESKSTSVFFLDYQVTKIFKSISSIDALVRCAVYNGYTYFEEGLNAQWNSGLMFSARTITKLADAPLEIGLDSNKCNSVSYAYRGDVINTKTILSSNNSSELITYSSNGYDNADRFENRVAKDGGIKICDRALNLFKGTNELFECDTVYVGNTDGTVETLKVVTLKQNQDTPYKITFLNKTGALESLWFVGVNEESVKMKFDTFDVNLSDYENGGIYSIHEAQMLKQNWTQVQKLKLNSGFYPEASNVTFQELIQSKNVWIEYKSKTLPVNVTTNKLKNKTHLRDNAINYSIEFEMAFNKINNVGR